MTVTTNAKNLRQHKIRFYLIAELILPFDSSPNIGRKREKSVSKFQINCVTMFYVIYR